MLHCKALFLCLFLVVLAFSAIGRKNEIQPVKDDSVVEVISQDETILFNMINDIRRQGKMPLIPLSSDLCKVAHVHISDLLVSKPQEKGCSLHSWSSSGKWTACCQTKDPSGVECMKAKPGEITTYKGNGYELIYWGEETATPADASALWQQVEASLDMILCRGKWKGYQWKAMGVGLKEGYALLWLGDKAVDKPVNLSTNTLASINQPLEKEQVVNITNNNKSSVAKSLPVTQAEPATNKGTGETLESDLSTKFYTIVASVKSSESAKSELKRIKSKGYPNAFILEGESVFRIAIASYENNKLASKALPALRKDFPGVWIFKK
jgi:hypothetical protein